MPKPFCDERKVYKVDTPSAEDPHTLTLECVRTLAQETGLTEAGVVALPHGNEARDAARFNHWIHEGRSGSMQYLARTEEQDEPLRARVSNPFPWARSAIVCLTSYNAAQPLSVNAAPEGTGWIARYAWSSRVDDKGERRPSDYHKVLLKRLRTLDQRLRERLGEFESRAYVDTGPIVERSLAVAAGLGWTGKNTCLIHPKFGSWAFLGVLVTSLEVDKDEPQLTVPDRCGSCRRCIEACPTDALTEPYRMDATRCIAYLTIEQKGPLDEALMPDIGRQVFGCDICQDVCPWNRKAPVSVDPELEARPELVNPTLEWLAAMDEAAFERTFNGSPVRRAGFNGLRRNVAVAMGNSGERGYAATLERWAANGEPDEGLRMAARWALDRLTSASESEDFGEGKA